MYVLVAMLSAKIYQGKFAFSNLVLVFQELFNFLRFLSADPNGELKNLEIKMATGEISTMFSPKKSNFDNHSWMKVLLQRSGSWAEKFQHMIRAEKNWRSDALQKLRRTVVSFYPCYLSPKVAQLNAKTDLLNTKFLLWGKVRACD